MIKKFSPIWFATVLGFGGIAIASFLVAKIFNFPWLIPFTSLLVYFNLFLFVFLFIFWILKAVVYADLLAEELKSPIMAGFHSLMPAAMIMIAINFSKLGFNLSLWNYQDISIIFWFVGAIFEFILLTLAVYSLIINEEMNINFINGGWLVPPVAALLTPIAGLEIINFFISNLPVAKIILFINYFFFGAGAFVFLLIAISLFSKVFFFEKLNPKIFPSFWIILVPFSLMSLSLSLFAEKTGKYLPEFKESLMALPILINPMLIGIGLWLLILLILLTGYYFKKIELPYGISWWAFVFPTASVSIASLNQSLLTNQSFLAYCGFGVYLILIAISLIVLIKTIKSFLFKNNE